MHVDSDSALTVFMGNSIRRLSAPDLSSAVVVYRLHTWSRNDDQDRTVAENCPGILPTSGRTGSGAPAVQSGPADGAVPGCTGISCHLATFAASLKRGGVARVKPKLKREFEPPLPRKVYGSTKRTDANDQNNAIPDPSCLTVAEWALVADLFEREGHRGKPPRHSRRQLLNARCYVVRTGCSWLMLPREFPHWDNVCKTFRRRSEQGKSSKCMIVCAPCGAAGKSGTRRLRRPFWMPSQHAPRRRAGTAAMTPARR